MKIETIKISKPSAIAPDLSGIIIDTDETTNLWIGNISNLGNENCTLSFNCPLSPENIIEIASEFLPVSEEKKEDGMMTILNNALIILQSLMTQKLGILESKKTIVLGSFNHGLDDYQLQVKLTRDKGDFINGDNPMKIEY